MRSDEIFGVLTGPAIRRLIRRHNEMIEGWNDEYPSSERDRLGFKEARFQTLLSRVLDESGYDVIVQSYLDRPALVRQSCDLFATKPYGRRRYWIEIKKESVDRSGGYGGINLIRQVLGDIGKMKAGKSNGDRVLVWIGFWGCVEAVNECVESRSNRYTFRIRSISPGHLRNAWKTGRTNSSLSKVRRLLKRCGEGSVSQAMLDLQRWIKGNGGRCEILKATRPRDEKEKGWVAYGFLCGMMK